MEKFLLVNYTGRKGGGPVAAIEMTKSLVKQGVRIIAVVSKETENIEEWRKLPLEKLVEIETYTDGISYLVNTLKFFFRGRFYLKRELQIYYIKDIYCPMVTFWTRMINKLFPASKKIIVIHDPIPHSGENIILKNIILGIDRAYKDADVYVVHTRKFMAYVKERYAHGKPVVYFPLGRLDVYKRLPNKVQSLIYDSNKINFLFFGTISEYKGLATLAEAYYRVKSQFPSCSLTIAGNGDFSPYEKLYEGLEDVNLVIRWIADEEVESFFSGAHMIVVLPYIDATQSGVVPLAMSYNIPVIATDVGGLSEQVENGVTGYLVEPNNAAALAEIMLKLAKDESLYTQLQKGAADYAKEIDWDRSAEKLMQYI